MARPAISSVLTPTYNRAHVLHRVYDSLNRQKTRDFEWIVVDDGSTDDTPKLLAGWREEADFPITFYRYSNNRGQVPAVNEGRKLVAGAYTLKLDSDDALTDDALETIVTWRAKTGIDTMPDVCGLAFRCVDELGKIVGKVNNGKNTLPQNIMIMSTRFARYEHGIDFDLAIAYKTSVYPDLAYGELNNCENLPPSIGLNRVPDHMKMIYVDRSIRIYYRHDNVPRLSDTPSRQVKWPRGNYIRALSVVNDDIGYFWKSPKRFLNSARKITRLGLHIRRSLRLQYRDLANWRSRLLWTTGIVGGCMGYLGDRLRGRTAPRADPDLTTWGPAPLPEDPVLSPPPERFGQIIRTEVAEAGTR